MHNLRSFVAASTLAGASVLSGCAALEHHVVMGTMEVGGKPFRINEPHHYSLESCMKDGQRVFDTYAREDFKKVSAAAPAKPVAVVWKCNDWVVSSSKGFELRQTSMMVPVTSAP